MWLISEALMQDYANSLSLPAQVAEFSRVVSLAGVPFAPSSGSLTQRAYLPPDKMTGFSPLSRYGMMYEPLTESLGADVLTWCLAGSPARTSVPQERAPDSPVSVRDFGRGWQRLSATWNRDTCSWKTRPSFLSGDLTLYLETLPRWGSMRGGQLWQRRTLVRLTNETESGSLPTPVKYDTHGTWESNNYHGLGWKAKHDPAFRRKQLPTPIRSDATVSKTDYVLSSDDAGKAFNQLAREVLMQQRVAAGTWPTPLAGNAKMVGPGFDINNPRNGLPAAVRRELHKTPLAVAGKGGALPNGELFLTKNGHFEQVRDDDHKYRMVRLAAQVKLKERMRVPTPVANDSTSGTDAANRRGGPSLKQMVRNRIRIETPSAQNGLRGGSGSEHRPLMYGSPGDPEYGELNPVWVEWLMGWPFGWTSLQPMDPAEFDRWLAWITLSTRDNPDNGLTQLDAFWWAVDPSDDGAVPRTTGKDDPARIERIAALGNGQASAAAAAAFIHLFNLPYPETQDDND